MRFAVVLHGDLDAGGAANAAAIVIGGLRSEGFGPPVTDLDGNPHAAVRWNMPILKAKTRGQLSSLLVRARSGGLLCTAFTRQGRDLSNSFDEYARTIAAASAEQLDILAVGLFGPDDEIRALTRAFSVFR
jgi:hypothetical protein